LGVLPFQQSRQLVPVKTFFRDKLVEVENHPASMRERGAGRKAGVGGVTE
jgi:hypothetical protein